MLVVFEAMSRRRDAGVKDDVLYRFRFRLFSLAEQLGNVRAACRIFEIHPPPTTAGGARCGARDSRLGTTT